jgi:DNA phosphorothioation-dependent restriction protein DptG
LNLKEIIMTELINKLKEMKKTMTYRQLEDILGFNARTIENWIMERTKPHDNSTKLIRMALEKYEQLIE